MTINEIIESRIARFRRKSWAYQDSYCRIDFFFDGKGEFVGYGPFLSLFSRTSQELIGEPTPQVLLFLAHADGTTDYEPYTGAIDKNDITVGKVPPPAPV